MVLLICKLIYRMSQFHFKESIQNLEGKEKLNKKHLLETGTRTRCRVMLEEMHEVHASEILSAWDRREPEKEDDLSITPSVARRYDVHVLIRSRDAKIHPVPSMGLVYLAT